MLNALMHATKFQLSWDVKTNKLKLNTTIENPFKILLVQMITKDIFNVLNDKTFLQIFSQVEFACFIMFQKSFEGYNKTLGMLRNA